MGSPRQVKFAVGRCLTGAVVCLTAATPAFRLRRSPEHFTGNFRGDVTPYAAAQGKGARFSVRGRFGRILYRRCDLPRWKERVWQDRAAKSASQTEAG